MTIATRRLRLAFISPVFLLPADTGGRIRTRNVLRGLKGGAFDITLAAPATPQQLQQWQGELAAMADRVVPFEPAAELPRWRRAPDLLRRLPVNVSYGLSASAHDTVRQLLAAENFDVVVFDFVHAAVLLPAACRARTVCFTHNVEAEIFARHAQQAGSAASRWLWRSQAAKMQRFEAAALRRFDTVIAVSERDARQFAADYGVSAPRVIPTGVDLGFFALQPAAAAVQPPVAVFTGSMDWAANVDGVEFFIDQVWPRVQQARPDARFVVVGRNPPPALLARAGAGSGITFTGFVDDVRPHVAAGTAVVIPLRVGGGTRIKVFEAMAMGRPIVSTALGAEGLDVVAGEHLLIADSAADQAAALLRLFDDADLRQRIASAARSLVERHFGHQAVARVFEDICLDTCANTAMAAAARRSVPAGAVAPPERGKLLGS